jgi:crossover junction endodeoxyribonuclease RuvC
MGLDPGSRRTGFGLIDCRGAQCVHVAHGCISTSGDSVVERLRTIFQAVSALITEHRPDEIAVERVFVSRNVESALKLGQARGAALSALPAQAPLFEYAPRAIKLAVVGFGAAEKPQVAHMMKVILQLAEAPRADAADALAVAVCHAQSRRLQFLASGQGGR